MRTVAFDMREALGGKLLDGGVQRVHSTLSAPRMAQKESPARDGAEYAP
jgi:hypothetical protein